MQIIAIANHKGGVGKTATAHSLGVVLATEHERRVLLVDCDPQASLTEACGIQDAAGRSLAEVMGGTDLGTAALADVVRLLSPRLSLVPSDIGLATAELGLVSRLGRESTLKRSLATVGHDYDVCLIDCPPSLGLLNVNALTAADAVLVPTIPQIVDLRGLSIFLDTLDLIRELLNPDLEVLGIVATFYDRRLNQHKQAMAAMRRDGLPLLEVTIGRSVRVSEAAGVGESVVSYAPCNKRAGEYRALGVVVNRWLDDAHAVVRERGMVET